MAHILSARIAPCVVVVAAVVVVVVVVVAEMIVLIGQKTVTCTV